MYSVDTILEKREGKKKGKFEYLVKWEGWDIKDSTWEPQSNLKTVKHLIEEFENKNSSTQGAKGTFNYDALRKNDNGVENFLSPNDISIPKKKKISKAKKTDSRKSESRSNQKRSDKEENKNNGREQKKGEKKNDDTATESIETNKANIKIHGMRKQENDLWFYISEGDCFSWVMRDYVVKNFPVKLCEFYEARMIIE